MGIITVAQAKTAIGADRTPVQIDDGDLQDLIDAAQAPMEDLVGAIVSRSCDEWHDGGYATVKTLWAPVLSVTTVTESVGTNRWTLTAQPLDGSTYDSYGYTVDLDDGLLVRRGSGGVLPFAPGRRNVHVVYTAGRATVPANIARATRRLVRWLYQTEIQGNRPPQQGPESPVTTQGGYDVPRAVIALCASDLRSTYVA